MIFQNQMWITDSPHRSCLALLPDADVIDWLRALDLNDCEEKWTFWVPTKLSRRWESLSDETRYALYLMGQSVEQEAGSTALNL